MFAWIGRALEANILRWSIGLLVISLLLGCNIGPDFHSPNPPKASKYTQSPVTSTVATKVEGGQAQHFRFHQEISQQWWELFHSEALTGLIKKGFQHNSNLASAQAALKIAEENLRAGIGSTLFPALNAQFVTERQKFSGATFGQANPQDAVFTLFNPSLNISYTLDLFGAGRRNLEALCAQVDYQRYLLEAAYLTLAANIATLAIQQAALQEQIAATQELVKIEKELVEITTEQFKVGGVPQTTVISQQAQLSKTQASLPPLEKNLAQSQHALAVLVGDLPAESLPQVFTLKELQLPTEIPLSFPSLLVRHRPDVRAAEALLHQASAQIGVATANLLPQITLTGSSGWESTEFGQVFDASNSIWNISGQILQPIFNGGALRAKRRAAIAAYEQAGAQYRLAVLQAFQNVADSLRALELDAKELYAQVAAEKSAAQLLKMTKQQFQLGGTNYPALLDAQRQYQQVLLDRIQAQAARYLDTVALFQALGGGWWEK